MRKLTIILTFIFLLLNSGAFACSCIGKRTVKEEIKHSDVVVVGKIITKELVTLYDASYTTLFGSDSTIKKGSPYEIVVAKYKLLLTSRYKGKITADTISIYTGLGGGDCGVRFEIGKEYIVYGEDESYFGKINNNWSFPQGRNIFWTNICSRTAIENKEEIYEIEKFRNKK